MKCRRTVKSLGKNGQLFCDVLKAAMPEASFWEPTPQCAAIRSVFPMVVAMKESQVSWLITGTAVSQKQMKKFVVVATGKMVVTASPDTAVAINQKWMARMAAAKMALQNAIRGAPVCADAEHLSAPLVGAEGLVCACVFVCLFVCVEVNFIWIM